MSVDLDCAVLDVSAFEAPHAGRAVRGDALDYVRSTDETYDASFVDIFDEQNVCPAFSEAIFLDAAAACLDAGGGVGGRRAWRRGRGKGGGLGGAPRAYDIHRAEERRERERVGP